MKPAAPEKKEELTDLQAAAAELVATRHRDSGRPVAEIIRALCDGDLKEWCEAGNCSAWDLNQWHKTWLKDTTTNEYFQTSGITVDPETLDQYEAPEPVRQKRKPETQAQATEISAALLRFMDKRLLKAELKWKESAIALRAGERPEQRMGAGSQRQDDGRVVEWVAFAVLIRTHAGGVRKVIPEGRTNGLRPAGWGGYPNGAARVKFITCTRHDADSDATSQAVGTLLLLFQGNAAGMEKQSDVAAATGCTKGNISAKAIRMARTAKSHTLSTLRCREKRADEIRKAG